MESTPEFASFKKVIIFGSKDSGKTSLSKRIERGEFPKELTADNNGKIFYLTFIYSFCHK